jgi:hypothetical protein
MVDDAPDWDVLERLRLAVDGQLSGYDEKLSEAVVIALGDRPAGLGPGGDEKQLEEALALICYPSRWRGDLPGLMYFFRALHKLVRDRVGKAEAGESVRHALQKAGESVRRDLQIGKLKAVFILEDGSRVEIEPHRWLMSEQLWWSGSEVVQPQAVRGYVYIPDQMSGLDAPSSKVDPSPYTPPFMKLMFEAIEHFEIPNKMPKAETLQEWFKEQQVGGRDVSKVMANYLATFVRPPEAMRGGQKRVTGPK